MGGGSTSEAVSRHYRGSCTLNTNPVCRGLYDPELEKDACGVGFAW